MATETRTHFREELDWPIGVDFVLNATFLSNAQKEAILGGSLVKMLRIA